MKYKLNKEKVGLTKAPHMGISSSGSAVNSTDMWADVQRVQSKIAHIYMPQKKHVHNHSADKTMSNYWAIDFDTESTYKSPLMQWTSATNDAFYSKGDNLQIRFPSVEDAITHAKMMGWGYTVSYPRYKYHTYKNYATNFTYKGEPKPEEDYD